MTQDLLILGGFSDWFPWYTWMFAGLLVAVLIGYKMHQKSQM